MEDREREDGTTALFEVTEDLEGALSRAFLLGEQDPHCRGLSPDETHKLVSSLAMNPLTVLALFDCACMVARKVGRPELAQALFDAGDEVLESIRTHLGPDQWLFDAIRAENEDGDAETDWPTGGAE